MNGIWRTKSGKKIEYKDLDNNHLLNILKFVKRHAKEGIIVGAVSIFGDVATDTKVGKEVLDHYDYKGLKKEAKKRGLKERDL